ncbi:basic blue protein-like [Dendrobium catenatum]|uniref:basic blue protein-like n=1 Tax=Dendrobium catenatum TaxID=906689 RepID=UPI0009F5C7D8|nr:basic blue protein-like [Dendrobium catenatum]
MAFLDGKAVGLCLFLVLVSLGFGYGATYKVGDEKGWTLNDKPKYIAWAKSKAFYVGDELLFQYDKQLHNVLQVNKQAYHKCNTEAPIAVFNTGYDSITIRSKEHLYFICGAPGHCEAGQKVSIKISKSKAPVEPSPTIEPPPSIDPSPWVEPSPIDSPPLFRPPAFGTPPPKSQASIAHCGLCGFLLSIAILVFNLTSM